MARKPNGIRHLERMSTQVPGLDGILGGGLFAGGVYFVQGAPGVGKTTLANQIAFRHVASGGRAIYATLLTESHDRLLQHLRRHTFFESDAIARAIFYVSAFRQLETGGLKGLVELIRRETTARQASLLVLDGLMLAVESADTDRELRLFIHEVQSLAAMLGCTVLLLTSGTRTVRRAEQTMVDGIIELEDRLNGQRGERLMQIRKFRGGPVGRGTHTYCITDDGIEVFPRLETTHAASGPQTTSHERIGIGIPSLDELLGGGVQRGTATLVCGSTGTGKTSIALHFLAANPGDRGLLLGFFENPETLDATATSLGLPFAQLRSEGIVHVDWTALADESLDEIGHRLLRLIDTHAAKRVVFDSMSGLLNASTFGDRGHRFLGALLNELRRREVTALFVLEPKDDLGHRMPVPTDDMGKFFDNVVCLRFIDDGIQLRRQLAVLKLRGGGFDSRYCDLQITAKGVSVSRSERRPA